MPELPKTIDSLLETPLPENSWQAQQEKNFNERGTFYFSRALYYSITAILMIGLISIWGITLSSTDPMLGLIPMTIIFVLGSIYFLQVATRSTQIINLGEEHVSLGRNAQNLHIETEYPHMYYMTSWIRHGYATLLSPYDKWRREYMMMVFRKHPCFPPLACLIDGLFPVSNKRRQVIFLLGGWKNASGTVVADQGIAQQIMRQCERHGIKQTYWNIEIQIIVMLLIGIGISYWYISRA